MKLGAAFGIVFDIWFACKVATIPAFKAILAEPKLLFRPDELSRLFMANIWKAGFGDGTDENGRLVKSTLITPNASGIVLDLGAGHGHTVRYLDRTKVLRYVALEPNLLMHSHIRETASSAGYMESDGSLVILACGAEDSASILATLEFQRVDTIISVLTLCTVPNPEKTIHNLVRDTLKSGGQFLFYEHVLSPRDDVAWWQRLWAPIWQYPFDGCRMDRPTHLYVDGLKVEADGILDSPWKERALWGKPDEPEEQLFWHRVGRFVKK